MMFQIGMFFHFLRHWSLSCDRRLDHGGTLMREQHQLLLVLAHTFGTCKVFIFECKIHQRCTYQVYMYGGCPPMCRSAQNDVCGHCQPCKSAQTNPTPDPTLALTRTLWGARGRQEHSPVLMAFSPPKSQGGRKPSLDQ